jgi:hypothetical protein
LFRKFVKTDVVTVEDRQLQVSYFELQTKRGQQRYSAEILLGAGDRIILDDDSLINLEVRAAGLAPATLYSRHLARTA